MRPADRSPDFLWCWNGRVPMPDGTHAVPRPVPADLLNRAIDLDRAGGTQPGRAAMRRISEQLPDWDEPILRLAESHRARGGYVEAQAGYRDVLALNPNRREALLGLGALLLDAGEEATAPLLHCCGIAPRRPDA